VIARLEEEGYPIVPAPADPLVDPERRWCVGHPDGYTRAVGGLRAVLEVKTVSQWGHRASGGELPPQYAAQVQHYLHLTGLTRAVLAVLVGGQRLEVREVERDDEAIALMLQLEEDFVRYLRRDRPPPPDGSDSAREALLHLFPGAEPGKIVRLDREHWQLVRELRARREQRKRIEAQEAELENRLKAFMGDAERALSPYSDDEVIRWTNVRATRIDTSALREHRPDVAAEYETTTTTRRFTLL
jgi:predicted phage-related endonuclease